MKSFNTPTCWTEWCRDSFPTKPVPGTAQSVSMKRVSPPRCTPTQQTHQHTTAHAWNPAGTTDSRSKSACSHHEHASDRTSPNPIFVSTISCWQSACPSRTHSESSQSFVPSDDRSNRSSMIHHQRSPVMEPTNRTCPACIRCPSARKRNWKFQFLIVVNILGTHWCSLRGDDISQLIQILVRKVPIVPIAALHILLNSM